MKFSVARSKEILQRTPTVLESLMNGISDDWLFENEGEGTWSPYDVLGHLIFGEKTDWIPRARIILTESENKTFEPFDRYAQLTEKRKSVEELLKEFSDLRERNLAVLDEMKLEENDLIKTGIHPELGEVKLKELLSCWAVHDLGHIAQMSRVMAKQYKSEVGPWIQYLGILK